MVEIPENTAARQAIDTIRGYAFQIYETAHAWLQLEADEYLLVEVADDYALVADRALQTVQVKDTPSRVVTLSSVGVIKTLNNLWALRNANPSLIVRATYLTTSTIGREKGRWFPNQQPGLQHWSQAAHDGGDLTALRLALAEQPLDEDFKAWIVQSDDACLRVELLQRVTFLAGSPGLHQRAAQLRASLRKRPGRNLSVGDTEHVADAVVARLLRVAAGQEPRDLTRGALEDLLDDALSVAVPIDDVRRVYAKLAQGSYHPPLSLRERERPEGQMFFFADTGRTPWVGRDQDLEALKDWLGGASTLGWRLVHADGGSGKSRLALELCLHAQSRHWSAGFLSLSSVYAAPERFLDFRPTQPTLMVIDYVGDRPQWAGDLVQLLIDRAEAGDLQVPVRILLLDRGGEHAAWYKTFAGENASKKGYQAPTIALPALEDAALLGILSHAAGPTVEIDHETALAQLLALDPKGRPLYAALAGDALREGRQLGDLSRASLANDILKRNEAYWKRHARDAEDFERHMNAAALATMVGGLVIPDEVGALSPARFPFTEAGFNAAVFKAIDGGEDLAFMSPVEPDILGGWLVLSRLALEHPFDRRPADLLAAAQSRAEAAEIDASAYGAFRLRALQDHPNEATRSGLLHAPPPAAAHHAVIAWLDLAFEGFDLINRSDAATAMTILNEVEAIYQARSADPDIAIAATSAAAAYIVPLSRRDTVASLALLDDLVLRATTRPELTDGLRAISLPASWLGQALVEQGMLAEAQSVFESLIALAETAARQAFKEREEVYEDAARTGLRLRQHCRTHDATNLAEALDLRLWGRAPAESADLAEAAGMTLMEWIGEEIGDDAAFLAELIERSDRRLDRPLISFWTANALYGQTRDLEKSQDVRAFVDMAKALAAWLQPRLELVPEMPEVLWDAEDAGWITDEFQLGPVVAKRLFDVWREEHLRVASQVEEPRRSNALADLRGELDAILDASAQALWSKAIRMALRRLDEVAGDALQARGGEPGETTVLSAAGLSI